MFAGGSELFARTFNVSPGVVPVEPIVVFEPESEQATGNFFPAAAGKRIRRESRIAPAPECAGARQGIFVHVETDFAEIAFVRPTRGVIVGGEIQVVCLHLTQHAVHTQEWVIG